MLPGITRAEAQWAEGEATVGLNAALAAAASRHGWTFLGGIFAASTPHGYCAADPWLVRLPESFRTQGDVFGTVHPNRSGHDAHAELIAAALTADFYLEGDLARPRSPRPVCPGDCDGDGEVTVDELILGVAIGIGIEPLESCPAFDVDGDGEVTIDELLQAVSAVLGGC
jgi:hypothetical protein